MGLAAAFDRIHAAFPERTARVARLRDRLEAGLAARVPGIRINGADAPRLPNISNVSFDGIDSEALLLRFDLEGIAVSAGSACISGAQEPSHVIAALNIDSRWQRGVIRFSLGEGTTEEEIDRVLELVPSITEIPQGRAT